jgi:hypothetical protein
MQSVDTISGGTDDLLGTNLHGVHDSRIMGSALKVISAFPPTIEYSEGKRSWRTTVASTKSYEGPKLLAALLWF